MKKAYLVFMLVVCSAIGVYAESAGISFGVAVNISGKQRMLSQRIGKAFVFKALGVKAAQAEKDLNASITIFEENLRVLKEFSKSSPDMEKAIATEETRWQSYKAMATSEATKEQAQHIITESAVILDACQQFVLSVVKYINAQPVVSKDPKLKNDYLSNVINISGRQRMLSQRFTLLYGAYLLGADVQESLQQCFDDFSEKLQFLHSSQANNTEIDDALSEVIALWAQVRDNKDKIFSKEFSGDKLYDLSISILTKMDYVTAVYEKLL